MQNHQASNSCMRIHMDDHDGIVYFTFSFFLQYKHTYVKEIVHFKKYMTYLLIL